MRKRRESLAFAAAVAAGACGLGLASACGSDDPSGPEPAFPADYATSYVEVRDCRLSSEHDLSPIRVLASPEALDVYTSRSGDFAPGAILLKAEYDFSDPTCEGPIQRWTVMRREPAGTSPDTLDWSWQDVDAERKVVSVDEGRCINCHTSCGVPPGGYLGTCTEE